MTLLEVKYRNTRAHLQCDHREPLMVNKTDLEGRSACMHANDVAIGTRDDACMSDATSNATESKMYTLG